MIAWIVTALATLSASKFRTKTINFPWLFFLLASLSTLCATLPQGLGRDRQAYTNIFNTLQTDQSAIDIEPIFKIISLASSYIDPSIEFAFFFIALISLYLKVKIFNKYSLYPFASFAIFLSYFFIIHETTQIRIGLALTPLYFSILSWREGKQRNWLIWGLIATLTHFSSLIFLLIPILLPKNGITISRKPLVLLVAASCLSVFLLDIISFIGQNFGIAKATDYIDLLFYGTFSKINYPPRLLLCAALIFMSIFSFKRQSNEKTRSLLVTSSYLIFAAAMSFVALSPIPVLAYRISDMLLFPMCFIVPIFAANFKTPLKVAITTTFLLMNLSYLLIYIDFLKT